MKKYFFLFLAAAIALGSCETYTTVSVTNRSKDKDVYFTFYGSEEFLEYGLSKSYTGNYAAKPVFVRASPGSEVQTIGLIENGGDWEFVDLMKIELHVKNNLAVDIVIKARDYIDNDMEQAHMDETGLKETDVLVTAGNDSDSKVGTIYTSMPEFTVEAAKVEGSKVLGTYPVVGVSITYTIIEGTMYVTVS